ncbi:MAG: hypothetical protein ABW190_16860 [Rhizobacter sp.]
MLLGTDEAQRALLFAKDQRYLSEVIDEDGLLVDNLMRAARACPPPAVASAHSDCVSAPASAQWFALDAATVDAE